MLVQDMKKSCMEQIIELQCTDKKRGAWFKTGEAVRLVRVADRVLIVSVSEEGKNVNAQPIDSHTESVLDRVDNVIDQCLFEVVNDEKHIVQVMIKQYSEKRFFDCTIRITEEFIKKKLSRQIKINGLQNLTNKLWEDTIFHPTNGETYYIVGIPSDKGRETDEYSNFVIVANDYYIFVEKKTDESQMEYFEAEKVSRKIGDKFRYILVRGVIKYTHEKEIIQDQVKQALGNISDDLYIKIWDRYGEMEEKIVFDRIRKAGAIRFVSFEPSGTAVRLDLAPNTEEAAETFASFVKKGSMINILAANPLSIPVENIEFKQFFDKKEIRDELVTARLEEEIESAAGRVMITLDETNSLRLAKLQQGYIFMSVLGDKQRLERRSQARHQIESMACPMTDLMAVLEGKRGSVAKKKNIEPLSAELLKDERYQKLTPNQIEAIRIALNTPDLAIIQGPPGTGKTTVITAIVKRLEEEADLSESLFGRSLITAFQHDAVENATDRLKVLGLPAIKFGRKYSETESDEYQVNMSIQRWITDKLEELNQKHTDVRQIEYMTQFYKLFEDYYHSAVSMDQTVRILKEIRQLVEYKVSMDLLEHLDNIINDLEFKIYDIADEGAELLIKAVRRIPTNVVAYEDNGMGHIQAAVIRLERKKDVLLSTYISRLKAMQKKGQPDFDELATVRKDILAHILPKEDVFTSNGKRDEVDILIRDIADSLYQDIEESKQGEQLILLEYMQSLEENPMAVKNAILDYSVVNGATNQQVMRSEIRLLKGGNIEYDNVLVDEAARSNPLDLLIPMSVAKDRIIMVGDHRQLPHIVDDVILAELEKNTLDDTMKRMVEKRIKESMFEQLFYRLRSLQEKDKITRIITLDKQFRMHPVIGSLINRNFYRPYGENVENATEDTVAFEHSLPQFAGKVCVWMDLPISLGRERKARSKSRRIEADTIAKTLKSLLDGENGRQYTYGIITFYREQVNAINEALADQSVGVFVKDEETGRYVISNNYWIDSRGKKEYVKVGTVDAFQGMEFDVVFLSMVRSNTDRVPIIEETPDGDNKEQILKRDGALRKKYGFLMIENRLCVSMSRAKKLLICVGDSEMILNEAATEAIPSLVDFYNICKEDKYGTIIK